jgi:hypothetical protein
MKATYILILPLVSLSVLYLHCVIDMFHSISYCTCLLTKRQRFQTCACPIRVSHDSIIWAKVRTKKCVTFTHCLILSYLTMLNAENVHVAVPWLTIMYCGGADAVADGSQVWFLFLSGCVFMKKLDNFLCLTTTWIWSTNILYNY